MTICRNSAYSDLSHLDLNSAICCFSCSCEKELLSAPWVPLLELLASCAAAAASASAALTSSAAAAASASAALTSCAAAAAAASAALASSAAAAAAASAARTGSSVKICRPAGAASKSFSQQYRFSEPKSISYCALWGNRKVKPCKIAVFPDGTPVGLPHYQSMEFKLITDDRGRGWGRYRGRRRRRCRRRPGAAAAEELDDELEAAGAAAGAASKSSSQ